MANTLFEANSRYAKQPLHTVRDARGRNVAIVIPPEQPEQTLLGYHILRQGERLDHLAARYLRDADGYWRICEMNDAMNAEQLSEAAEIAIPVRRG